MTTHPVRVPHAAQLLLLLVAATALAGRAGALTGPPLPDTYLKISYSDIRSGASMVLSPSSNAAPGFGVGSLKAKCNFTECKQEIYMTPSMLFGTNETIKLSDIKRFTYRTLITLDNLASVGDWCVKFGKGCDRTIRLHVVCSCGEYILGVCFQGWWGFVWFWCKGCFSTTLIDPVTHLALQHLSNRSIVVYTHPWSGQASGWYGMRVGAGAFTSVRKCSHSQTIEAC